VVGQAELELRPILRAGEVLEAIPGLVATQHSGSGKANQYFLRGFNLDHGTDFATAYGPMPVNMRSHGHGQGYTDLGFVIPELVQRIDFRKGPYHAEIGDFGSAGSATLTPFDRLEDSRLEVGAGEDRFGRLLSMGSFGAAAGELLYAFEGSRYDGPWTDISEDLDRVNAMLRWTRPVGEGRLSLMGMVYDASWNSADQIPRRAVRSGAVSELGSLDTRVGGESSRHSLSAEWSSGDWRAAAYSIAYELDLWSNFTYFLEDPEGGDQFLQTDRRRVHGAELARGHESFIGGTPMYNTVGLQWRYDDIDEVGLARSRDRELVGPIRGDSVAEGSLGLFLDNEIRWSPRWRSTLGLRYDSYTFRVSDQVGVNLNGVDLSANGGNAHDAIASLRSSVMFSPSNGWELYAAAGQGFHSNDARGVTARVDPADGSAIAPVDPLVRSRGAEAGLRIFTEDRLNASLSLWWLALDSELLFVGDAGNTEANRASERKGVELTAYYAITPSWSVDLEYALSDARFTEPDGIDPNLGDEVPGAIDAVLSLGLSGRHPSGILGGLRARYFGPRDLEESGGQRSSSSLSLNLRAGYERGAFRVIVDVLNLLDSDDHDITYWYESRLPNEAEPVADIHYHVMEPRTVRLYLGYLF
jgi:outer membrane receptor protein involved in Fe transport